MAGSKSMIFPSLLDQGLGIAGGEVSVQDAADRGSRGRATNDPGLPDSPDRSDLAGGASG